jgi:hypothetical protein
MKGFNFSIGLTITNFKKKKGEKVEDGGPSPKSKIK